MNLGASKKHLEEFGKEVVKGLFIRFVLLGSSGLFMGLAKLLMMLESHGYPSPIKAMLTALVLLLFCFSWVSLTLWCVLKLRSAKNHITEEWEVLKSHMNKINKG